MESQWSVRSIRIAIHNQRFSFPSQVPVFLHLHRPDIQWRVVILYFVRGWPRSRIGQRYGLTAKRVGQLLRQWTRRAMDLGYLDRIPPGNESGLLEAV